MSFRATHLLTCLCLVLVMTGIQAQERTVQVRVIDSTSLILEGVDVQVEGADKAATTNFMGKAKVSVPDSVKDLPVKNTPNYQIIDVIQNSPDDYTIVIAKQSVNNLMNFTFAELANVKVVTSSKKEEKINDAPNVMYVFTAEEIKRRGYKSYLDILTTVPGMNVFHGDFGYFSQVRGVAPNSHNKVTYMVNGRQVNQLIEANMLTGPVSLDNAERVEIIVGPGSVLYGAETLLAIVNIITKTDASSEVTARIGQDLNPEADPLGYKQVNATIAKQWSKTRYYNLSFSALRSAGWDAFDSVNIKDLTAHDKVDKNIADTYYPSFFLTANARYDDYNFQYVSYNAEQVDIGRTQRFNAEGVRIDKINDFMFEKHTSFTQKLKGTLQGNYTEKRSTRTTTKGVNWNTDLSQTQYNLEYAVNYTAKKHYIQAGVKYTYYQNRLNYDMLWAPDDPVLGRDTSYILQIVEPVDQHTTGLYISEEWEIHPKVTAVIASRFDYNKTYTDKPVYISPRLALILKPQKSITTKLMYNTSTHMPDITESPLNMIYGADKPKDVAPFFAQTNELATKPEYLQAYEVQNIFTLNNHRVSINGYYQKIDDFISWFNPSTNMGNFEGYGGEAEWKAKVAQNTTIWSNFAYSNTNFELTANKFRETSNYPSNEKGEIVSVPRYTVNAGVDQKIWDDIYLSMTGRYFTMQPAYFIEADSQTESGISEEWGYVNNMFYLDVNVLYENAFIKNFDIALNCKNATNNQELIAAQFRQYRYAPRGRSLIFVAKYRF